jgi:subtilisin family serine protease
MKYNKDVLTVITIASLFFSIQAKAHLNQEVTQTAVVKTKQVTANGEVITSVRPSLSNGKAQSNSRQTSWIVELEAAPLFIEKNRLQVQQNASKLDGMNLSSIKAVENYQKKIISQQAKLETTLVSTGLAKKVLSKNSKLSNFIVIEADAASISQITKMQGVKRVIENRNYAPITPTRSLTKKEDLLVHREYKDKLINSVETNETATNAPNINTTGTSNLPSGEGVKIAILDTGIDYNHPNLGGCFGEGCKVAGGYDVYNDDPDPLESDDDRFYRYLGHGTHVAGIAAGKKDENGLGSDGVAPDAIIYAYKVCGRDLCSTANILTGLEMASDPDGDPTTDDAVDIINLSLGSRFGDANDPIPQALNRLSDLGITVVAGAGNDGGFANMGGIASAQKAITVAASFEAGQRYDREGQAVPAGITPSGANQSGKLLKTRGLGTWSKHQ